MPQATNFYYDFGKSMFQGVNDDIDLGVGRFYNLNHGYVYYADDDQFHESYNGYVPGVDESDYYMNAIGLHDDYSTDDYYYAMLVYDLLYLHELPWSASAMALRTDYFYALKPVNLLNYTVDDDGNIVSALVEIIFSTRNQDVNVLRVKLNGETLQVNDYVFGNNVFEMIDGDDLGNVCRMVSAVRWAINRFVNGSNEFEVVQNNYKTDDGYYVDEFEFKSIKTLGD